MKKILLSAALAATSALLNAAETPIAVVEQVETNIVFDAQGICQHLITTNTVFTYTARNGEKISFDPGNIVKMWNGVHNIESYRSAIHGAKGHTVITNGVKYIQYADGYIHAEKMIPARSRPRRSSKWTPFHEAQPRALPPPLPPGKHRKFNGAIEAIRARRRAALAGKPKVVNATFGPGGELLEAKDAESEAEVKQ